MKNRIEKSLGLIAGRHDLPVQDYVFGEGDITFPINPAYLYDVVRTKLDHLDIKSGTGDLTVYVTGLTPALVAVIKLARDNGHYLTLMYHDRDTDSWIPDVIFGKDDN
ncbi:hypothetical protein ACVR1G_08340 [Streptococcus dentasini]